MYNNSADVSGHGKFIHAKEEHQMRLRKGFWQKDSRPDRPWAMEGEQEALTGEGDFRVG